MSMQYTICNKQHGYEFYGPRVPPCPHCGSPELKSYPEYLKAMGLYIIPNSTKLNKEIPNEETKK